MMFIVYLLFRVCGQGHEEMTHDTMIEAQMIPVVEK